MQSNIYEDAEESGDELQSDPRQNLTVTSEHPIGFHGTTTLIILFVLLGIVLAAAVGTRIWYMHNLYSLVLCNATAF